MIKRRAFSFFAAAIVSVSVLFTSCSDRVYNTDYIFSTGHRLSEDEISKLNEKLTSDDETSDIPKLSITESTVYYWTDGGKKLHLFSECQALSRSDASTLRKGTLAEAFDKSKTEPCAFCLEDAGLSAEDFPVFVPSSDETSAQESGAATSTASEDSVIYIWTKNGSKLHLFEDCTYLSRTPEEKRSKGNAEDASLAGLSEICSSCQKRAESEN